MSTTQLSPSRTQVPAQSSWFDRFSMRMVFSFLRRTDKAPLRLILPDGSSHTFGGKTGGQSCAEIHIHRMRFFSRILLQGEIGFGEGFMEGDWSTPDLPLLICTLIDNLESIPGMSGSRAKALAFNVLKILNRFSHWRRRNTRSNSKRNIQEHYDLSNDFYSLWLDETLTYSSAWFNGDEPLEQAQENKYQRLCEKLQLQPGMQVLEIGCGWGGFSIHAARHFGVHMTAITISKAQFQKARERVEKEGLSDKIKVRLCDYREVQGTFDAIVSIEMLEAVGHQFLRAYFEQCHKVLKPDGRVGLQVIVCPDSRYDAMRNSVDWIKKHIFPGGQLPSIKALLDSANATGDLYLQHLENFGLHYAKTLKLWREQFNRQREAVQSLGFDEKFLRKWNYYLAYCEAAFQTRNINVSQMILTRPNNTGFGIEG
jgi:cyclopropane-fatty-acyl-phospholipid synthase